MEKKYVGYIFVDGELIKITPKGYWRLGVDMKWHWRKGSIPMIYSRTSYMMPASDTK